MVRRRSGLNAKQLKEILERPFYKNDPRGKECKASIQNPVTRNRLPESKRNEQHSLVRKGQDSAGLVHIPGQILCRITRHLGKRSKIYDDDNQTGGCKELRDSIAAALSLKGDSEEDGIKFEYRQIKSRNGIPETEIEIFLTEE